MTLQDTASGTSAVLRAGGADRRGSIVGAVIAIAITGVLLALVPIWIGDSRSLMGVAVEGLLFACYVIAFNIIFGSTGQLFLCVGALAGVGAFSSALLADRLGVPFPLAMLLAALASSLIAGTFSWIAVRRSLDVIFTGIVTLTFALGFTNLLVGQGDLTGGENGLVVTAGKESFLRNQIPPYYAFLVLVLVFLVFYAVLHRSHVGWAFRALRDDEVAAELSGVNVARYRIYAGAIGGAMLGFSGALWAHSEGFISPDTFAFANVDVRVLVMLVFGGIGTLMGPVVGAAVFTYIGEVLASFSQLRLIAEGTLLIVLFLVFPQGVVRAIRSGVERLFRTRSPPRPPEA